MEENVKNAIFNYENGFVTKGHMPNENYVPQKMTGDNGIPLNANQLGGTEPLPGDEPQQEGPSLIDSIKDSLEKAADNNYTMQGAFDALTNAGSKWMREQPLYRNIMMSDEEKLLDAQKIGDKVGLNPQLLADNQFLYKEAKDLYDRMEHKAFLDGKDFSANSITELYPEVDLADPVQAAIALKHAREILQSRNVIQGNPSHNLSELGASTWDTVVKSWEAGDAAFESGELQYKAMTGELSNDEVEERLKSLEETEKKYKAAISDSMIATVAGEAIKMGRSMYRMTMKGGEELVEPLGPGVTMALQQFKPILQSAAVYGGATVLGAVGATGAVAGAGIAGAAALVGAVALAKAAVYTGTYRAEAGSAYWDWINKKDAYGNRLYTRDQALGHARRVGHMNAAIETVSLEYAIGGISKVMGPNAAMAVIKNKEALTGLIGAGRKAIAKKSVAYAGKQLARTAAPEILEEGIQQAVGDIDENIFGRGGNSAKDILSGAIDAMMQATPAAVGMALGGAGIAGVGAYRGMRKVVATLSKMETAVTEFKRANEKSMNQQLIALRDKSDLYKKSPETYRKTIQSQLEKEGNGTIYIDAQAAAENEATHEALNQMVESGTITSKELDNSIKTGKPLELEAGRYLQTATPETHEALADYSTMDKGERTLHAIKEERQRYKDMIDIVTSTKEKREAAASEKILKDHFSEDTEKGREDRATAQELLSGGLDHLQENYKTLLEEAKKAWGDLSGVKDLQDYMERRKTQDANTSGEKGVDFIDIGEGPDRVHIRESKNPDWYQDFYSDHDRAPTQRELYDVAHQKTIKEVFYKNDEDSHMGTQELEAAKAKVESLERVGEVIETLDKKDLVAQTLLDPDTYEEAYKPLLAELSKGNPKVAQAARDSALVLAKLAENFHKNYGIPLKLATVVAGQVSQNNVETILRQMAAVKGLPETGKEFTMPYYHINNQGQVKMPGDMMAQSIEPAGEYMGHDTSSKMYEMPNATYGTITFKNPLVLEWKTSGHGGWKTELSEMFGGKKGKRLTNAIKKAGYDGIITVEKDKGYINETVNIAGIKSEYNESLIPDPPKLFQRNTLDADENLKRDIQRWNETIDKFTKGKIEDLTVPVITTPLVLKLIGAKILPIEISAKNLNKILKVKHTDITSDIIKQIPEAITDPLMIFSTYPGKQGELRKVIVLNLKDANGATIVVPIELESTANGYLINEITSAYGKTDSKTGKPSFTWFEHQLLDGKLEYINRKKTADWISAEEPYWHMPTEKINSLFSDSSVANENDLVKVRKENPGYYQRGTEEQQDLVVTHNITTDKLEKSIQLGGLPMPSLGISRKGIKNDLEGFGEITLFTGRKESIIKDIESHTAQVLPVKAVATDSLGRALSMSIPTIQKALGIVKEEHSGYYQTAYHGTPYEFSKFDLGAIGSGEGNQAHGWGLYFTKNKSIAETRYRDRILKWLKRKGKLSDDSKGTVFEVDVPEDSVLLDEDKPLSEQPLAVRKAIADYYNSRPDDYITSSVDELPSTQTGERFYRDVVFQMQREGQEYPQKAASELLNSFGIKGITYEGSVDGRCFVVFDDQAISIIEKYNQEMNGSQYQGAYNPNSNVIEIFNGANQSTAIHEGAHMFLTSLENLSQMSEEELIKAFNGDTKAAKQSQDKVRKDLMTIRNWAVFSEEHLAEYKGTSLEKEFNAHADAIRRGDANAEEIWIQERFARGFEKYLMDGSAPTKEMQGVFRRFKKWLTDIYKTAKNLGNVNLTPEIKDVFDKMLATEEEINAWAAQRKLESIDKAQTGQRQRKSCKRHPKATGTCFRKGNL